MKVNVTINDHKRLTTLNNLSSRGAHRFNVAGSQLLYKHKCYRMETDW